MSTLEGMKEHCTRCDEELEIGQIGLCDSCQDDDEAERHQPYTASIEFAHDPVTIQCECSNCDWKGNANQLNNIDDAILTPGDHSPAGRCPECASLAYVIDDKTDSIEDTPTAPNGIRFVTECMEYSNFGPLAMAFIIDAITKQAEAVAEADPEELAKQMEISPVHPEAWQGVAKEIKDKFDKFFNRHQEHGNVQS